MRNFKNYFIAAVALVAGFAISACTPDDVDDKKGGNTTVEVTVGDITPNGATITVTTEGIKEYAYIQREEAIDAAAIFLATSTSSHSARPTTTSTTRLSVLSLPQQVMATTS